MENINSMKGNVMELTPSSAILTPSSAILKSQHHHLGVLSIDKEKATWENQENKYLRFYGIYNICHKNTVFDLEFYVRISNSQIELWKEIHMIEDKEMEEELEDDIGEFLKNEAFRYLLHYMKVIVNEKIWPIANIEWKTWRMERNADIKNADFQGQHWTIKSEVNLIMDYR